MCDIFAAIVALLTCKPRVDGNTNRLSLMYRTISWVRVYYVVAFGAHQTHPVHVEKNTSSNAAKLNFDTQRYALGMLPDVRDVTF